jgi:hypothetical protein
MLAIRLPEEIEARLDRLARLTGKRRGGRFPGAHRGQFALGEIAVFEVVQVLQDRLADVKGLGAIAPLENPRAIGEALKGSRLGEFWKYRVGDYRLIT